MSFLDVNIIKEKGTFTTSFYRKPTFCQIYTHFDCFLPSSNKTESHSWLRSELSLRVVLLVIICYFVTILHLSKILLF